MFSRPRSSLRVRLALLIAMAIVPTLGLILFNGLRERRIAAESAAREGMRLAYRAALRHGQLVEGARQVSAALAQMAEVRGNDPAACARFLSAFRARLPFYSNVIVALADGEVFATAVPLRRPLNMADRPWFREAVRTRAFVVGGYQRGRSSGKPMIVFGEPVMGPGGEVDRVVSVGLDLSWLNGLAPEAVFPTEYTLTLLDAEGTVLLRYPEGSLQIGKRIPPGALREALSALPSGGTVEAEDADGISRVYSFVPLTDVARTEKLYVEADIPSRVAFAGAQRALYGNLAVLTLVAAATLLTGMFGAKLLIFRPVRELVAAAERLSAGDLAARVGSGVGGELGQLAAAFDGMATSLQVRIAERQQALAEVRESEQRWRILLDNLRLIVVGLDPAGRVEYANRYFYELTGHGPEEVIGQEWFSRFTPQDPGAAEEGAAAPVPDVRLEERYETRILVRSAEERTIQWFNTHVRDVDGSVAGTLRIGEDVTERRRSEAALLETNRTLSGLIEASPVAIVAEDGRGRVRIWNPTAEKIFGWTEEEVLGEPLPIIPPGETERSHGELEDELRGSTRTGIELKRLRKDGSLVDVSRSTGPFRNGEGDVAGVLAVFEDISARKQTEEENRRLQEHMGQRDRLAAVGQLAAGIAHDFNNILLTMTGSAEMVMLQPGLPEPSRKALNVVIEQGFRAAQLIRQILDFSRKSVSEKHPLRLDSVLKELCKLLQRTLPEQIHISLEMEGAEHWIDGDPTQIQQIGMNLAVNARDAMPAGGTLVLRLEHRQVGTAGPPPFPDMKPGDWVVLSLTDTGVGIPPEHLARIFEPFFTTKAPGKGTGLGLAQVYGLVKQHDGFLGVESRLGQGTTFTLYFPMARPHQAVQAPRAEEAGNPGRGERVLVVEDEALVLQVLQSMLERMGYRVLTAKNGEEALTVYEEHRDAIRLILTDWVMPESGGAELAARLRSRGASVKILAMSGYPLGEEEPALIGHQLDGFLQKPVRFAELAEGVDRAIGLGS